MNQIQVRLFLDDVVTWVVIHNSPQYVRSARYDKINDAMRAIGFDEVGGGSFKRVWGHNDARFVVKVSLRRRGRM